MIIDSLDILLKYFLAKFFLIYLKIDIKYKFISQKNERLHQRDSLSLRFPSSDVYGIFCKPS